MKKLVMSSYILLLLVLIILSGLNFSPNITEKIEGEKQAIIIIKPEDITTKEYIKSIKSVVDKCNADIMYKYTDIVEGNAENYYYTVENNEDFVDDNVKDLLKNLHFEKWTKIAKYDLSNAKYYVGIDKTEEVLSGIKALGYEVQIDTTNLVFARTSVILFAGVPVFLMIMSMIFYTLSIGKSNVLKKMEGYSPIDLLLSEAKWQSIYYAISFLLLEIITLVVANIYFPKAVIPYLKYELKYILVGIGILVFSGIVSTIIVCFQNRVEYIKGKVPKKGMYFITMAGSIVFLVFLVFFMTIGIRNVKIYYDTLKTSKNISEKVEGYVTFPIYENNVSATGLEDNYLELYKETVSKYEGILIDADNYSYKLALGKTPSEEYDQDYISINSNYLKFNPIYDEKGQAISIEENTNEINVLLPNTKLDEKEKYISYVENGYNLSAKVINYDAEKTKVYGYNSLVGNDAGGELEDPVIIVENSSSLSGVVVSAYCSSGSYFIKTNTSNPYEELKPILEKTGIIAVTPETPYISSGFSEVLSQQTMMFTLYATQTIILSLGLICLIVFSGILFCENYKDKIVNKLIEGHTMYKCINNHLVIKVIVYLLSGILTLFVGKLMVVSMNYFIIPGALVFDILFTILICKRIARKKVYDLVKGAE